MYQKVLWKGSKTVLLQFKKNHKIFYGVKMISFYRWGPKRSTHFSKIIIYLVPEKPGRTNDAQTSTCLISLQHINEKKKKKQQTWAQSNYKYKAKFLIVIYLLHGKQSGFLDILNKLFQHLGININTNYKKILSLCCNNI